METSLKWLSFLRHYGPIPRNDNMYDETIQRSARLQKITPIHFEHPLQDRVLGSFDHRTTDPVSVILTGTAGDGKTHLCRQVWKDLGGHESDWASDSPYLTMEVLYPKDRLRWPDTKERALYRSVRIHFIRDLSGWAPQQGSEWEPEKEEILQRFCGALFDRDSPEVFLIAANDGQLVEAWRRLRETESVAKARALFEDLLVENRQEQGGVRLQFFNLSRSSSADLFDRATDAFLGHEGWGELVAGKFSDHELFGARCPIRHNYELLGTPLIRKRLRSLFELCDHNGLHVPIRQILILLTNAVLGHPDGKDHLMTATDVPKIIAANTISRASFFSNVFGGNLSEIRRQGIPIFDYLERFQIGYETSNRIDNLLIFGENDENLGNYFEHLLAGDSFYGAGSSFFAAKRDYIEGNDESPESSQRFLHQLIGQRQGLFFKIPEEWEKELSLWELTVFKFAGEYLTEVVEVLRRGSTVKRSILSRLIKGLNRVFTGMLFNSDRELYLATSGNNSQAKVSRILIDRISVDPSRGERVVLGQDRTNGSVQLSVYLASDMLAVNLNLSLIRFEFLSRIALEGALPASFSKECYEDLLAFKTRLIAEHSKRQSREIQDTGSTVRLNLLALTDQGTPNPRFVEVSLS